MNQNFKQKVMVTSLMAAFGMVAGVAGANQFAASAASTSTVTAAPTVSTAAAASAGTAVGAIKIQEIAVDGVKSGYITIKIPSTVKLANTSGTILVRDTTTLGSKTTPKKLTLATVDALDVKLGTDVIFSAKTGALLDGAPAMALGLYDAGAGAVTSTTAASTVGAMYFDDATSETVITLALNNGNSSIETASIGLWLAPVGTGATGDISLSLSDGNADLSQPAVTGLTSGSVKVMTLSNQAAGVSATATTLPTVKSGSATPVTMSPVKVTALSNVSSSDTITIALDNGAKFRSNVAAANVSSANSTGVSGADFSVAVDSTGKLTLTATTANFSANDALVMFATNDTYVDTSGVTGDVTISATVTGTGSLSSVNKTVAVATAKAAGATAAMVDTSGAALTSVPTLYVGRDGQTVAAWVKVSETAPATALANGTLTLALDQGAKFDNASIDFMNSSNSLDATDVTLSTAAASTSTVISAASSTGAGVMYIGNATNMRIDATSATAGDVTLTLGGTAGIAGTVKIATLQDATSNSMGGSAANLVPGGSAVALADITITESAKGALVYSATDADVIKLSLPSGVTFDTTAVPTVKVYNGATEVTNGVDTVAAANFTNSDRDFNISLGNGFAAPTAAYSIKIAGLKAKAATTASTGSVTLTVGGADQSSATTSSVGTIGSDKGAKATKGTLSIATVLSGNVQTVPAPTVTGALTSQTITGSITPAANSLGLQGSVFVAAVLPASAGGAVYFKGASGWALFTTCAAAPAYSTGTLATTSFDVVSATDLSGLVGTQVYVGYGMGGALSPAGTACNNMLNNGTYQLLYTVQ